MTWHAARDKRHVGQTEETFTPHFRIFKFKEVDMRGSKVWALVCHVRMAGWRPLGRYETQQEAMSATDTGGWWVVRESDARDQD